MDRRNLNINSESISRCIQSKNLLMHWDLEKLDPISIRHEKHLKECDACTKAQKKLEEKAVLLNLNIPRPIMSSSDKETFIGEVNEVFNRLEFSNQQKNKKEIQKSFMAIAKNLNSIIDVFFTRKMLSVYGAILLAYIVISQIILN